MEKKIAIITCLLVPEALEVKDEELEKEIREGLESTAMPWCMKILKVKVLGDQ